MEKLPINPLKLLASRICLGTWSMGGLMWGGSDQNESINTIITAIDKGINIIDTAPVYGRGLCEELVGKALMQTNKRHEIIVATKAGLEWGDDGKVYRNSTPSRIRREIEDSLRRLQTDYIDLYQVHWPDPLTPIADTAKTMLDLLNEGKIRAIGVSNYSVEQMQQFLQIAPIHTSQPPYNLFERQIETSILPFTEKNQIVTLGYGALCRGLLSGRMRLDTEFAADDIRQFDPKFQAPRYEQYLNAIDELRKFAQVEYGVSVIALAVRWILDRGHTIALWGARHPQQLAAIDEVMNWNLDAEAMKRIDAILENTITDPVGAEFMQPPSRKEVAGQ